MQELIINKQTAGGRADKTIMKFLDKAPSGFVYKMLRKKNIVINDKKAKGDEILKDGDVVKLYLSDDTIELFRSHTKKNDNHNKKKTDSKTANEKNQRIFKNMIVYEDDNIIIVNKPSGMLSQKNLPSDLSVNDLLVDYLGKSEMFTPGISNRLDRNTSGLMIAGKNPNAVRELNKAIKDRQLKKIYLCIVAGKVTAGKTVEGYLVKDEKNNKVHIYKEIPESENASYIKTAYKPLSDNGNITLLSVDLITGKSHQIRAHLASEGHPIIGDSKYGSIRENMKYKNLYHVTNQQLHAYQLFFEKMEGILEYLNGKRISCALTPEFNRIIKGEELCLHGLQEV